MSRVIKREERTARKHHWCNAWEWFSNSNFGKVDLSPEDWAVVERVMADSGRILPGTRYIHEVGIYYGEIYTFKGRLDMHAICLKYDIYQDD